MSKTYLVNHLVQINLTCQRFASGLVGDQNLMQFYNTYLVIINRNKVAANKMTDGSFDFFMHFAGIFIAVKAS